MDWIGAAFLRMDKQMGRPVLLEFIDTARINSLRTLPYLKAWHERYAEAGLRVIGVHCPGYSFGRDRAIAEAAVERLEIPFPVVLDPDFLIWREYGNKGWPGRYVFDRRLRLRYIHYGEGDYQECEQVVQELLAEANDEFTPPPDLVDPLRPEEEPGVLLEAQTADIALPDDRERVDLVRDWVDGPDYIEAADAGAAAEVTFNAGSAWAVLSGDDVEPGLHEVPEGTVVADSPGLRLHGFQFTPLPPG
jgi:AhpC/TSA family